MKQLTVHGMHCESCKKLIMMELEENNLEQSIESIEVGDDQIGIVYLKDSISDIDLQKIKTIIAGIDEYTVD